MDPDSEAVRKHLEAQARALGFHALGVAPVPLKLREAYYRKWIASGQHGTMEWMERNNERRLNPQRMPFSGSTKYSRIGDELLSTGSIAGLPSRQICIGRRLS